MPILKSLFSLMQMVITLGAVLWLYEQPGQVSIDWMGQTHSVSIGMFVVAALGAMLLSMLLFGLIKAVVELPTILRRRKEKQDQVKGYRALTLGLTAVAAGDGKEAALQAARARKWLAGDAGLPVLLDAQAARLQGREADALDRFKLLAANQDTSFMGVRGLLQVALDSGDYARSMDLALKAASANPKQPWPLKILYDLQVRNRQWSQARASLQRLEKMGVKTKEEAISARAAMLLDESDQALLRGDEGAALSKLREAIRLKTHQIAAVERLAQLHLKRKNGHAARAILEKTYKATPHPFLVAVWEAARPEKARKDSLEHLRWAERLTKINPQGAGGFLLLAERFMDQQLWGEASAVLDKAEALEARRDLFALRVRLAELSGQGAEIATRWKTKMLDAPPPMAWVCRQSGQVYDRWYAIANPHGAFNTIVWDEPRTPSAYAPQNIPAPPTAGLLDGPIFTASGEDAEENIIAEGMEEIEFISKI